LGLSNGDTVRVGQSGSTVEASVQIRERIEQGVCFLIEGTSEGNANGLLNGSPVSVTIEKAAG
jgi:anaerobic selenocysteine-containing dehydrogenase